MQGADYGESVLRVVTTLRSRPRLVRKRDGYIRCAPFLLRREISLV